MPDLSQCTVTFLVKGNLVLLGYKKTGFGQGNYLGIGGKIENQETEAASAAREIAEEISVINPILKKVGDITFLFPEKPSWSQQAQVFICEQWEGEPAESDEIRPEWRSKGDLPLSQMWDDAHFWLPAILNGHSLKGTFTFDKNLKVVKSKMEAATFA
jgi:8-oxo-dGTP diphosphatase